MKSKSIFFSGGMGLFLFSLSIFASLAGCSSAGRTYEATKSAFDSNDAGKTVEYYSPNVGYNTEEYHRFYKTGNV